MAEFFMGLSALFVMLGVYIIMKTRIRSSKLFYEFRQQIHDKFKVHDYTRYLPPHGQISLRDRQLHYKKIKDSIKASRNLLTFKEYLFYRAAAKDVLKKLKAKIEESETEENMLKIKEKIESL